jgi:hypothetical protein
MPVNPREVLARGGKELVDLLQFALITARPDPVFVLLVREYRFRPTAAGAVALFEQFCAPTAPARVRADSLLPPKDPNLAASLAPCYASLARVAAFQPTEDNPTPPLPNIPPTTLFDRVAAHLTDGDGSPVGQVAREFYPDLGPHGSLANGTIAPGHRVWVENVWCKRVRPALVAAGFWRVSSLGQP